jgi:hypothetical protein
VNGQSHITLGGPITRRGRGNKAKRRT